MALSAFGEMLYAEFVFKCPKYPAWYNSYVLLFSPFIVFLICGVVLNKDFWVVFHGYFKRDTNSHMSVGVRFKTFWSATGRALIVPCTWLFVSLMDGDYYACNFSERPIDESSENYLQYKSDSQLIGWTFLVIMIAAGTVVTCFVRCFDNKTFLEARYASVHQHEETTLLEERMKVIAKAEVQKNVDKLFVKSIPPKATWDVVTEVDCGDAKNSYYTPLHKWAVESVEENTGNSSKQEEFANTV